MQKKCEMYWPENAEISFVPGPESLLVVKHNSILQFAEFVIREMSVTSVSSYHAAMWILDHALANKSQTVFN